MLWFGRKENDFFICIYIVSYFVFLSKLISSVWVINMPPTCRFLHLIILFYAKNDAVILYLHAIESGQECKHDKIQILLHDKNM